MRSRVPSLSTLFRHLMPGRTLLLLAAYSGLLALSLFLAYELRFDFVVPERWREARLYNLLWIIPFKLALLFLFGQFGGLLSYFRLPDMYRVFSALAVAGIMMINAWYVMEGDYCPPRSVILGDFILSLVLICGFRVGLRVLRERAASGSEEIPQRARRVGIVGAGDVGATVASDLLSRRGLGMRPIVFLDDDRSKWKRHVHGITVVDSPDNLQAVKDQFGLDEIIIAMPSAPARRIREIIQIAQKIGLKAEIVPSLAELTTGKVRASRVRPVDIEDLLGREAVDLDSENIRSMIAGRVVMVTGAGGSIGSELCRQISFNNPQKLLLVEQSELQLFQIEQHLNEEGHGEIIVPLVADVLDAARIRSILNTYRPQIVFHAAAHKHVYMMERQPGEAFKNNTLGTKTLADLASEAGVERFLLISTDKAINPTNAMGACKRLAEIYIQAKSHSPGNRTRFMAVRFGNVLGSSGSVVPIFRRQIAHGGPVTVTHPEVMRYFMTIPEAVGLVLQSATQGEGGEIFVLDMGQQVKMIELARQMIELSGFRPEVDIEIEIIGLRPGEKLYEEVQHTGETLVSTQHPRIMRFVSEPRDLQEVQTGFEQLLAKLDETDGDTFKDRLKGFVPEYTPYHEGETEPQAGPESDQ